MYEQVYKEMVAGGIAVELPNKEWLNKEGVVVLEEKDALGLQTKYNLICPDRLLFVDEVVSNTSQTKDGNVWGSYFSVERVSDHSKDRHIKMHTLPFLGLQLRMGIQLCVPSFLLLRLSKMNGYLVYILLCL